MSCSFRGSGAGGSGGGGGGVQSSNYAWTVKKVLDGQITQISSVNTGCSSFCLFLRVLFGKESDN